MATQKTPEKIVDIPEKATPVEPGESVVVPVALGATFAERKAARLCAENKAIRESK